MIRPIRTFTRISTQFKQGTPPHKGIDYATPEGTPVVSPVSGVVTQSYLSTVAGNTLEIKEANGRLWRLLHLKNKYPVVGDKVKGGQLVGLSGGRKGAKYSGTASTGPHLHWDGRKAGSKWDDLSAYFDPELALRAAQKPIAKAVYYIVRKGDWLSRIAQNAHTTVRALLKFNPQIKDANVIHPNDKIRTK